jgi:hypothetical protein
VFAVISGALFCCWRPRDGDCEGGDAYEADDRQPIASAERPGKATRRLAAPFEKRSSAGADHDGREAAHSVDARLCQFSTKIRRSTRKRHSPGFRR